MANDDIYERGKILSVDQTTVNIFLVDCGDEQYKVPMSEVIEIPKKFIESPPFQVIFSFLLFTVYISVALYLLKNFHQL